MLTYGKYQIDPAQVPAKNILAMLQRGVSHYLGNEVSAKVINALRAEAKAKLIAGGNDKPTAEAIEDLVNAVADEDYAAVKQRLTDDAFNRLMTGEVGQGRVAGPSITPLEKAMLAEAKARVKARLAANGLKVPKGDETITIRGQAKTFETFVDEMLAREGTEEVVVKGVKFESIERVAKRAIAEQEKRAKAAKALREAADADGSEAEGL